MRLRKECEHGRWEEHAHQHFPDSVEFWDVCPGGEFLPKGALVIEKIEGEWSEDVTMAWLCRANRALRERPGICLDRRSFHPQCCWVVIIEAGAEQRPTGWNPNQFLSTFSQSRAEPEGE